MPACPPSHPHPLLFVPLSELPSVELLGMTSHSGITAIMAGLMTVKQLHCNRNVISFNYNQRKGGWRLLHRRFHIFQVCKKTNV